MEPRKCEDLTCMASEYAAMGTTLGKVKGPQTLPTKLLDYGC